MDLVLNNLQWLICLKTQPTNHNQMNDLFIRYILQVKFIL